MSEHDTRKLIRDLLEEEALVIGGLIAVHDVEDEFVWRLFRSLDLIRRKALRRLNRPNRRRQEGRGHDRVSRQPHPAAEEFLARLRRG
jgi:hypothetical protein